ncbi:MAG: hypothetical protein U0521_22315 [Anaerolineae bacterium]
MRVYPIRFLLLLSLSLALILFAPLRPSSAQELNPSRAFYLGYDLSASEDGAAVAEALYVSSLDGQTTKLSAADANVIQYRPQTSGERVAYITRTDDQLALDVVQSDGTMLFRLPLPEARSAIVQVFTDLVWLTTTDADNVPTLRGVDADSGEVVAERKFSRANVDVSVHPSGNWALAYHAETGRLNVLQLPALTSVSLELSGYALTAPKWSPVAPQFLMGARALDNPDDMGVLIADVTAPSVLRFDAPDFSAASRIEMDWSKHGQYVVMEATAAGSQAATPSSTLIFINAETGALASFNDAIRHLQVLDWSASDSYALVQGSTATASGPSFELFDPATSESKPLASVFSNLAPLTFAWSPATSSLGILGRTLEQPGYEVMTVAADTLAPATELLTQDIGLEQSSLRWSADGQYLIFAAPITDPMNLLLDLPNGVFAVDRETDQIVRLSPDDVAIVPLTLDVQ